MLETPGCVPFPPQNGLKRAFTKSLTKCSIVLDLFEIWFSTCGRQYEVSYQSKCIFIKLSTGWRLFALNGWVDATEVESCPLRSSQNKSHILYGERKCAKYTHSNSHKRTRKRLGDQIQTVHLRDRSIACVGQVWKWIKNVLQYV